ncbi:MAG: glycosyltransferase [Candidatus Thermoplasmatota archaeon]|nr:glycosyltransferase [Candidatus Thermoplasmatota archaeon]
MEPASQRPSLLVIKGSFSQFGGAERDILRQLEAWKKFFDVRIATLNSHFELEQEATRLDIPLFVPDSTWSESSSAFSRIAATSSKTATKAWKILLKEKPEIMQNIDAIHLVTGAGSIESISIIPENIPIHVHMLEPNRGLHGETVLWAKIDGTQPRPIALTRILLTIPRNRDLKLVNKIAKRPNSRFSGNSDYIKNRILEVHNIEAGVLLPCVDLSKWTIQENNVISDYVVTIGRASWVKGTWECIQMLTGTEIGLVHVGGGDQNDIKQLKEFAKKNNVKLEVSERLEHDDLVQLLSSSLGVVSLAHKEPFGLTPVEAHAVGVPSLMVNEGGFSSTIIDGESGRLLPRDDYAAWHSALKEAAIPENRKKWSAKGREIVNRLALDPESRAIELKKIIHQLIQ